MSPKEFFFRPPHYFLFYLIVLPFPTQLTNQNIDVVPDSSLALTSNSPANPGSFLSKNVLTSLPLTSLPHHHHLTYIAAFSPHALVTANPSTVPIVLPFPECPLVEIVSTSLFRLVSFT